jgi:ribosomal protein S18 acetylase RimI-like enzyme
MPRVDDPIIIRAVLESDRDWAVYALGDLAPERFALCDWHYQPANPQALLLLFRGFDPPVLFLLGGAAASDSLLDEIGGVERLYLHVRPDILPALEARYLIPRVERMWRMVCREVVPLSPAEEGLVRLGAEDVPALQRLYADGEAAGEAPGFFLPAMVTDGVYFGTREGRELVAVAGTHLVVAAEGVAAIGNIYTRRDRRGRGLARALTARVTGELIRSGFETIALNVAQGNSIAIRIYEQLGFRRHCAFVEGVARRLTR